MSINKHKNSFIFMNQISMFGEGERRMIKEIQGAFMTLMSYFCSACSLGRLPSVSACQDHLFSPLSMWWPWWAWVKYSIIHDIFRSHKKWFIKNSKPLFINLRHCALTFRTFIMRWFGVKTKSTLTRAFWAHAWCCWGHGSLHGYIRFCLPLGVRTQYTFIKHLLNLGQVLWSSTLASTICVII